MSGTAESVEMDAATVAAIATAIAAHQARGEAAGLGRPPRRDDSPWARAAMARDRLEPVPPLRRP